MLTKLWNTLRAAMGRTRFESELHAELDDHLAKRTDELVAMGMDREEATRVARREFGSVEKVKDEVRDSHAVTVWDSATRGLRFALRSLWRNPVFSLTAMVTLGLGIGASTAIFSVVNAVLLRDLPYSNASRIYRIFSMTPEGLPEGYMTPHDMTTLYDDHPAAQAAAIGFAVDGLVRAGDGTTFNMIAYGTTDQFFEIFDTPMTLGRAYRRGETNMAVLAYSTWRNAFHSDPNILGKRVQSTLLGQAEIVGVASPDLRVPANADYWSVFRGGLQNLRGYDGYLRLRSGVTQAQIETNLATLSQQPGQNVRFAVQPVLDSVVGKLRPTVILLFGASALLLLIACINVANLLFSRGIKRRRELAVREALGARRGHVMRTLLTESFVLATIGGALGLLVAMVGVRLLLRIVPPDLPRLDSVPMDATVLWFGVVVTALTGFVTGIAPALSLSRNGLRGAINEGGRGSASQAQHRIFGTLVVAEIGLAVVLVIGAGLLIRSYYNLSTTDPGFRAERLLTFYMEVPYAPAVTRIERLPNGGGRIADGNYEPVVAFWDRLMERIRAIPGVESVSGANAAPFRNGQDTQAGTGVIGRPAPDGKGAFSSVRQRGVTPDFFQMMGIRMVAGRGLEETDTRTAPGVTVVNEAYVRRYLPDVNPLGQRLSLPDQFYVPGGAGFGYAVIAPHEVEVVGVVSDVKYWDLAEPAEPTIYLSNDQYASRRFRILVRAAREPAEDVIPAIRAVIKEMDKTLAPDFSTYSEVMRTVLARQRLGAVLLLVFGSIALILAAVGIYGLMSYVVAQRTGEMAVRAAMGATGAQLRGLIVQRGVKLALAGVVIGVLGAAALRSVVASQLYEVSALDWRVFSAVPLTLLAIAVLSSYLPAIRAAKADPASLLRTA